MKLIPIFGKRKAGKDSCLKKAASKSRMFGFTLIELLVVISIIGLLSSAVIGSLSEGRKRANDSKRSQELAQLKIALEVYYTARGNYPALSQGDALQVGSLAADLPEKGEGARAKPFGAVQSFLSKITPVAYAQSLSAGCTRFNSMADTLVAAGNLGSVPRDPRNSPESGICYKAWSDGNNLTVYTYLEERYVFTHANKKIGFVLSKNSDPASLDFLRSICEVTGSANLDYYPVFNPSGSGGSFCSGPYVADKVLGITSGIEEDSDGGIVGGESGCSDAQYGTQEECESEVYVCSDGYSTDQGSCESNMCGGGGGGGYCQDQGFNVTWHGDEPSCLSEMCMEDMYEYCVDSSSGSQVGFLDPYECENAMCGTEWSDDYGNCGYYWTSGGGGEYSCNNWYPEDGGDYQCTWDSTGQPGGVWTP